VFHRIFTQTTLEGTSCAERGLSWSVEELNNIIQLQEDYLGKAKIGYAKSEFERQKK
jgi:hypothetical protein